MTDRRAMDADGGMCACGYPKPNCMHHQCIAGEQGADSEGYDEEEPAQRRVPWTILGMPVIHIPRLIVKKRGLTQTERTP